MNARKCLCEWNNHFRLNQSEMCMCSVDRIAASHWLCNVCTAQDVILSLALNIWMADRNVCVWHRKCLPNFWLRSPSHHLMSYCTHAHAHAHAHVWNYCRRKSSCVASIASRPLKIPTLQQQSEKKRPKDCASAWAQHLRSILSECVVNSRASERLVKQNSQAQIITFDAFQFGAQVKTRSHVNALVNRSKLCAFDGRCRALPRITHAHSHIIISIYSLKRKILCELKS